MAQILKNLKNYCQTASDHRLLKKGMNMQNLSRMTRDKKIRWFELADNSARLKALEGDFLDCCTLNLLFPKYHSIIAPYKALNFEQFKTLLDEEDFIGLYKYTKTCNLDIRKLRYLVSTADGYLWSHQHTKEARLLEKTIREYFRENGCIDEFSAEIERFVAHSFLKEIIREELNIHFHCSMVRKHTLPEGDADVHPCFLRYLKWLSYNNVLMPYEAEILMSHSQLKAFHANGLYLSKKAVLFHLTEKNKQEDIILEIFRRENLKKISAELQDILASNIDTFDIYLKSTEK